MDTNKNIMWVQGAQGTGKTQMANFLESINGLIYIYEIKLRKRKHLIISLSNEQMQSFKDLLEWINSGDSYFKIIIFSQDPPPPFLFNQAFNPIHITLKNNSK